MKLPRLLFYFPGGLDSKVEVISEEAELSDEEKDEELEDEEDEELGDEEKDAVYLLVQTLKLHDSEFDKFFLN